MGVLDFFFNKILNEPSILLAVVAMIGYAALKKPFYKVLSGGIKTAVGFRILQTGAGALVKTFRPLLFGISEKLGIQGIILDPYSGLPAATKALESNVQVGGTVVNALSWVGYSMMLGFALNIILVLLKRFTRIRTIFLTGHIMYLQSAMATWFTYYILGLGQWQTIIFSGLFLGLYWSIFSNLTLKPTEAITGGAGFAVGHQQMFGDWLAYKIAPVLGDPKKGVEDIKLPGWLSIFHDNVVASGLIMTIFFGTLMLIMGPEAITKMKGLPGKHWITRIILTSLAFPVGVTIILTGVKMFVAELTESFEGIRQKLIPGSAIAIDCAATYGFAPEAVLFGFLFGAFGQIVGVALLLVTGSPIFAIPGFVPMFFDNATIGIFANKFGGARAAAIICFASGIIQILGGTYAAHLSGLAYGSNTAFPGWGGSFDLDTVWIGAMWLMKAVGGIFGLGG